MRSACGGWIFAVALMACGGGSSPPLEIDVVVGTSYQGERFTTSYIRERERPCDCSSDFPAPDQCATWSDSLGCDCMPYPGTCLQEVRTQRGGEVLDRYWMDTDPASPDEYHGSVHLGLPDGAGDARIVFSGCGDVQQADLPATEAPAPPPIQDIAFDAESIILGWDPPASGVDRAVVGCAESFSGLDCNNPIGPELRLAATTCWGSLHLVTLTEVSRTTAPLGEVRVWNAAGTAIDGQVGFPELQSDGHWSLAPLVGDSATIDLTVDGVTSSGEFWIHAAVPLDAPLDESLFFEGVAMTPSQAATALTLQAGPETDAITVTRQDITYAGSLPHQVPIDGLVLGSPEVERYELAVGPVTLVDVNDPGNMVEVSFHVRWTLGIVARPVP